MTDPFVAAVLRIALQHYHGQPPTSWVNRLAPQLNHTAQGRTALGAVSTGNPLLLHQFASHGFNNYPYPVAGQ